MIRVEDLVASMTDAERIQCIRDMECFSVNGAIGDCLLRSSARKVLDSIPSRAGLNVCTWMDFIANECHRYYSKKYLDEHPEIG